MLEDIPVRDLNILSEQELIRGIEVLREYSKKCIDDKEELEKMLANTKTQVIERDSGIAMYKECIRRATKMIINYSNELLKKN